MDKADQKTLDNISSQSTLAQFIESKRPVFSGTDVQLLQTSDDAQSDMQKCLLQQVHDRLNIMSDLNQDDLLGIRSLLKLDYTPETTSFQYLSPEIAKLIKPNLTYAVTFINGVVEAPISEVSRATKDDVLRDIAQYLGEISIDMRSHEAVERQLAACNEKQEKHRSESRPVTKLSPAAFGLFTKHFYGTGLYFPIETMLSHLRLEIRHAHILDLHSTYVPFLQELIGLMLMYGIPMTNDTYSSFFECVLDNYLERFVGHETKDNCNAEHSAWIQRANAARVMLESFDHSYFRDILGSRYESKILPTFMKLVSLTQTRSGFESVNKPSLDERRA